jgi:hypothetical protein
MVNDFIYMADKLSFYPQYLSVELSNLSSENNLEIFNKQAKELIIKFFHDSSNDLLKESIKKFA